MATRMVKANGIGLCVKEAGSGRDMVLIHGKGYSKENMDRLFNHYREQFHVVSYDVRGHGESDKPAMFTLEDDVTDLIALFGALHLEKPIVIGFSMGSYIALKAAEEHPTLISRLVLIGTKGGGSASSTQMIEQQAASDGMTAEELARQMLRKVFAPQATPDQIAAFDREIKGPVTLTAGEQEAITQSLHGFDLLEQAHAATMPVLVLTGEYDGINPPAEGKKVADALPDARFEEIPHAGHITFFENPGRTLALIDEFVGAHHGR